MQVERQDSQIRELLQSVSELEKKHSFLPRRKKDSEPQPPPPPVPPLILPATPLVTGPPKGAPSQEQQSASGDTPKGSQTKLSSHQSSSVISGAMTILEQEFLPEKPTRYENGLVMQAVEYAQNELFRHHNNVSQIAY